MYLHVSLILWISICKSFAYDFSRVFMLTFLVQACSVRKVDKAINRMKHHPADSVVCFVDIILWVAIYQLDSKLSRIG